MQLKHKIHKALDFIISQSGINPQICIVLGSGMGGITRQIQNAVIIPTQDIPYYPTSTVEGHKGQWILGQLGGKSVVFIQGRVHVYEGYTTNDVTFPIHLAASFGIKKLILTTASGGLNPDFYPGQIMLITNHINMAFANPLRGNPANLIGPRFPVLDAPYDSDLINLAEIAAARIGVDIKKGVFIWVTGPAYETVAEVRLLRNIGGDAVSMSTVPEVIAATQRHLKTLGVSLITNLATGLSRSKLTHQEVTEAADRSVEQLSLLIQEMILLL
ncbi:purine-nucleoside phosphorylase [candidate division KSB1 bacterium]|nr:purine-nucleoside phosphorylase [candidate division KSB1 bacterium]